MLTRPSQVLKAGWMRILIGPSATTDGMVQMILRDFAAQGVAVDSQDLRGTALISLGVFENSPDKLFLELRHGFFEQNPTLDHHSDQRFQLLFHLCMLRSEAPGDSPRA